MLLIAALWIANGFHPVLWWPVRAAVLATMIAAAVLVGRKAGFMAVISPPFMLAYLVATLYALLPALACLRYGAPIAFSPGDQSQLIFDQRLWDSGLPVIQSLVRAVASPAEALSLAFSLCCLAVGILVTGRRPAQMSGPDARPSPIDWRVAFVLGLTFCAINWVRAFFGLNLVAVLPPTLADQIYALLPVSALVCFGVLLWGWMQGQQPRGMVVCLFALLFGGAFLTTSGKVTAFPVLFAGIIAIGSVRDKLTRLKLIAALLIISVAVPVSVAAIRQARGGAEINLRAVMINIESKFVFRQSETIYCLNYLHFTGDNEEKPFFFLSSVIPRLLWPQKPSLSNGGDYAWKYCGMNKAEVERDHHSSSITLLGEMLLHGRGVGLVVGVTAAMIVLGGVAYLFGFRWWGFCLVFAVSPWLIDYDQPFSMWFANTLKFSLAGAGLLLVLSRFARRSWRAR